MEYSTVKEVAIAASRMAQTPRQFTRPEELQQIE
jgi:hypothetical protein